MSDSLATSRDRCSTSLEALSGIGLEGLDHIALLACSSAQDHRRRAGRLGWGAGGANFTPAPHGKRLTG
jgi:hypothetical protein